MGSTKVKVIDDSVVEKISKKKSSKVVVKPPVNENLILESKEESGNAGVEISDQEKENNNLNEIDEKENQKNDAKNISKEATFKKYEGKGKNKGKIRSKRYLEVLEKVEKSKLYPINDAIELVKSVSYTKFISTIELHINTTVKNLRGLIAMPYVTSKKLRVLAFGKGAEKSGADIVGTDEILEDIKKGKIDFDVLITTPEYMPKLATVAKILGPKGLMPNPKNGTINKDLEKAIKDFQSGKTEYKTEREGKLIHLYIGKVNQPTNEIKSNIVAIYNVIGRSKISNVTLSPTMGPSVKVLISSIS